MQASPSSSSRKRPREGETESQRIKREKAAERQRRKRERDRNAVVGMIAYSPETNQQQHPQHPPPAPHHPLQQPQHIQPPPQPVTTEIQQPELSQTEIERRDRVRAAARERQRKHRRMVKERKMRELGLDMGNEMIQPMEDVHYRNPPEAQYPPVIPHDMPQIPPPHAPIPHEPPFPQGPPIGGQTFASTLLLSFSCAPLLKQHLLRTLNMTNEELASLEPVIAEAWDRWDHQRRIHYAEQAAKGAGPPQGAPPNLGAPSYMPLAHDQHGNPTPFGAPPPPGPPAGDPNANEFRARFHRPLLAQPPFRAYATDGQQPPTAAPPATPTNQAANPAEAIDPHLSGGQPTASGAAKNVRYRGILAGIDPQASTIQLSNVYSMGTESRRPPHEFIPPVQEPYQYIIFRASEVKDLAVDEPVPQRSVHDDPAVLGASAPGAIPNTGYSPYPTPAAATSVPGTQPQQPEVPPANLARQGQPPKPTGSGQAQRSQGQSPQPQATTSNQQQARNNDAGSTSRGSNSVQTAAASLETVERALGDLRVSNTQNGGARGGRRGGHTGGGRQSHQNTEQIKVPTTDFDFESMNARFNKAALAQQQQAVTAATENAAAGAEGGAEGEEKDKVNGDGTSGTTDKKPEPAYNPQKSFFDSLSSSTATPAAGAAGERGRGGRRGGGGGGRNRREEERERNVATFGEPGGVGLMGPGAYVGGWGGYGRRGGRPRRGGGPGQSVTTRG